MAARHFRSAPDVYADICAQLDAEYGYPSAATKTLRTLPVASELPSDGGGRVYLSISAEYCDFVLPSQMLPALLASGVVEELTEQQWVAMFPSSMP